MPILVAGDKAFECRLIIFDKDGTLIDQKSLLFELAEARKRAVEKNIGLRAVGTWEKMVGVDLKKREIDKDGPLAMATRRDEVVVAATAFYLNKIPWDEAKPLAVSTYDLADRYMEPPYGSVLIKGVSRTLKTLKSRGLKLAIASTDTHKRTEKSFKALRLIDLFDEIVGSDDVEEGKPAPDMILRILKKLRIRSDEAIMIGDMPVDLQMGRSANVKACIGVLTGSGKKERLEKAADAVVKSVSYLYVSDR